MLDNFSSKFAAMFGLRNAIILSELCVRNYAGGCWLGTAELLARFDYLSRDQVREALGALKQAGMIVSRKTGKPFTRELEYRAEESAMNIFIEDMTENRVAEKLNRKKPYIKSQTGRAVV
jgi:DNA-binding GntR family transcriptional regulator